MAEHLWKCPNGHIGRIDDDQLNGEVSIDCPGGGYTGDRECDFHGYVDDGGHVLERNWA